MPVGTIKMTRTMKPRTPATLVDVAKAAGVSTATVSRCINSPEKVVASTREKVSAAITELGYMPNFGARAMAVRKTNTIGAIIPTMENAIFARGLQAFQEELRNQGFTLLVASSAYDLDVEEEQIRSLIARGADGLLLIGHDRNQRILSFIKQNQIPAIAAWTYESGTALPSVGFDNKKAMQEMANHVVELGHSQIGVISAQASNNDRARQRLAGIREVFNAQNFVEDQLTVIETAYGIEEGGQAFEKMVRRQPRPTAIICGNDVIAVGAIKRARELGIRVPDEVSITGFDDIELGQVTFPTLTTVQVPHREMGIAAAKSLVALLSDPKATKSVKLETSLIIRESLASAPIEHT